MKAAVFAEHHRPLEIRDIADPAPAAGQVVIDVHRCGICGSDLHLAEDPAFGLRSGDVLGHEFAGEVVALGSGVQRLRTGDLVSVIPLRGCGQCPSCLAGEPAWCAQMLLQGGGYAEFAIANESQCVAMPQGLSFADGAIIEPLAVALHGVQVAEMRPGAKVVIVGAGPVGLSVAYWARRLGASKIVMIDLADYQRERAHVMGATHFIAGSADPIAEADAAIGGKADIAFECVGVPGMLAQCIGHVGARGRVVVLGLCARPDSFVPFAMVSKEVRLQASAFFTHQEYHMALEALEHGSIEPRALVTDTISIARVPDMFEALKSRSGQCKVLISHH